MNERYAFPGPNWTVNPRGETEADQPGMTLRDYFAAKAMQGLLTGSDGGYEWSGAAEDAYRMADAMLAEREQTQQQR